MRAVQSAGRVVLKHLQHAEDGDVAQGVQQQPAAGGQVAAAARPAAAVVASGAGVGQQAPSNGGSSSSSSSCCADSGSSEDSSTMHSSLERQTPGCDAFAEVAEALPASSAFPQLAAASAGPGHSNASSRGDGGADGGGRQGTHIAPG
jgi:hypothetical protein